MAKANARRKSEIPNFAGLWRVENPKQIRMSEEGEAEKWGKKIEADGLWLFGAELVPRYGLQKQPAVVRFAICPRLKKSRRRCWRCRLSSGCFWQSRCSSPSRL